MLIEWATGAVWESSFGPILIEIVGNNILVNGSPVEQAALFFNDGAEFHKLS